MNLTRVLVILFIFNLSLKAAAELTLGAENFHYLSSTQSKFAKDAQVVFADLKWTQDNSYFDFFTDVKLASYLEIKSQSLIVRDLYMKGQSEESAFSWKLGRYNYNWNKADQFWKLGYWQPLYIFDPLRPEEQGIVGGFLEQKMNNWNFIAFYSPLFIPHMGIDIKEKNGDLTSVNRWYRPVPQEYTFEGVDRKLVYDLKVPELKKIVSNDGFGLGSYYTSDVFDLGLGYSHKPVNKLAIKRKQILKTQDNEPVYGDVTVFPIVIYSDLISLDLQLKIDSASFTLSLLKDYPKDVEATGDWFVQRYKPSQTSSFIFDYKNFSLFEHNWNFSLGLMKVIGEEIEDVDAQDVAEKSVVPTRFDFTQAVQTQVSSDFNFFSKLTKASVAWIYDESQQGSVFQTEWRYYYSEKLDFKIGLDIMSVRDEEHPKQEEGFINQYRSNDRFNVGLNYAI